MASGEEYYGKTEGGIGLKEKVTQVAVATCVDLKSYRATTFAA